MFCWYNNTELSMLVFLVVGWLCFFFFFFFYFLDWFVGVFLQVKALCLKLAVTYWV